MALHEELGPRETTVTAIAKRAGVQRLTVYRHFHDEAAIFTACTSRWIELNPPPDPSLWADRAEAGARTVEALSLLYGYYEHTARMWKAAYRDRDRVPALEAPMAAFDGYLAGVRDDLLVRWQPNPPAASYLPAIIGLAVRFSTWLSLSGEGLPASAMARLFLVWIQAASRSTAGRDD